MLITRKAEFSASHVCRVAHWDEARNREFFGPAANPLGHGHNYVLEVTLKGEPDPVTGLIYDLKNLKRVIQFHILDPMDHRHLNQEVPPFDRVVPTTENIAREIWRRLQPALAAESAHLHAVRLFETDELYVDYAGEDEA